MRRPASSRSPPRRARPPLLSNVSPTPAASPCALQPDVLLNYGTEGLGRLLARRAALALSAAVKLAFLVNGLLSLPMCLYPYQVGFDGLMGEVLVCACVVVVVVVVVCV